MRTGAKEKGLQGEELALAFLSGKGYRLLERRFHAPGGEIDLIMEADGLLVFVEVKYRPAGRPGSGMEAVTAKKQRRILLAAGEYLLQTGGFDRPMRFDVVEVTGGGVIHVENAFSGSWPG